MTGQSTQSAGSTGSDQGIREPPCNEVRLIGRLAAEPQERILPSGDALWTFRVIVARPPSQSSRVLVDALECAVWSGRVRRSVRTWRSDDLVEVTGALRRRFYRTAGGPVSRVEVEVASGRIIRRAAT